MVAVGARIGEDVDAAVADLHGQRVGVGVRGDAEVAVRAAVAAAPDLRGLPRRRAQQGDPGVGEPRRPLRGPACDVAGPAGQGADDRAARVRRAPVATSRAGRRAPRRARAATASGSAPGRRAAARGLRRRHPGGAGAAARRAARRRCRPSRTAAARRPGSAGGPLPRPRRPRAARVRRRSTGSRRPARGRCPRGRCCGSAHARADRADFRRQRSLSGNHGKAQLATSCPAASAMTWLLADEPRLRNAARYCWCQRICRTASSSCSNRSATPGQSSSSRRIQARLIRRIPISMPLVQ